MSTVFTIPNLLSLLRILLAPVFVFCLILGEILLAVSIFSIAAITDYYDGYFARKLSLSSKYGMFIDPLADKVLVLTTFTAFYVYGIIDLWMVIIIFLRDLMVTGLRVFFAWKGSVLVTSRVGKWKTVSQFLLIYTILGAIAYSSFKGVKGIKEVAGLFSQLPPIAIFTHLVVAFTLYSGLHYLISNRKAVIGFFNAKDI